MKRIRKGLGYTAVTAIAVYLLASLVVISYAQADSTSDVAVPEPQSIAFAATGFVGWLVQVARRRYSEFKRIFDSIVAAMGIVVAAPFMLFAALVIKIVSPGPVLFAQDRVGLDGKIFKIYKLRTMRVDAERYSGPVWAKEDDPRLIRYGKLMRKLHVDELPQLYNVLKGDMSIVGPRPERPVFVEKLCGEIGDYRKRIAVKPGITGLAQVWHKYDETVEDVRKKVKYDLLYIREMCLMVDIRIMLRTLLVSARGKGAR